MIWLLDTKLIDVTHFCIYDQINDYRTQAVQTTIYLKYLRIFEGDACLFLYYIFHCTFL